MRSYGGYRDRALWFCRDLIEAAREALVESMQETQDPVVRNLEEINKNVRKISRRSFLGDAVIGMGLISGVGYVYRKEIWDELEKYNENKAFGLIMKGDLSSCYRVPEEKDERRLLIESLVDKPSDAEIQHADFLILRKDISNLNDTSKFGLYSRREIEARMRKAMPVHFDRIMRYVEKSQVLSFEDVERINFDMESAGHKLPMAYRKLYRKKFPLNVPHASQAETVQKVR